MPKFPPQSRVNVSLDSSEILVISKTLGLISELTILDTHWTRTALGLRGKKDDASVAALGKVIGNLDSLLVQSQPYFAGTADIFAARADDLRQAYSAMMFTDPSRHSALTEAQRQQLQAIIDSLGGDFANAAVDAARRLAGDDRVANERKGIADEFEKVRAGNESDGDFSGDEWGDIALIALAASAMFGPEGGAIVMGGAGLIELLGSIFQ